VSSPRPAIPWSSWTAAGSWADAWPGGRGTSAPWTSGRRTSPFDRRSSPRWPSRGQPEGWPIPGPTPSASWARKEGPPAPVRCGGPPSRGCGRWWLTSPKGWTCGSRSRCLRSGSRAATPAATAVAGRPTVDGQPVAAVVLAMPDPQAADLLGDDLGEARDVLDSEWDPVVTVVASFPERSWRGFDGMFVHDSPVSLLVDDGRRRGDGAPVLVVHSTHQAGRDHLDDPAGFVEPALAEVRRLIGDVGEPSWSEAKRWGSAEPRRNPVADLLARTRAGRVVRGRVVAASAHRGGVDVRPGCGSFPGRTTPIASPRAGNSPGRSPVGRRRQR
jgi:hypothetical protein